MAGENKRKAGGNAGGQSKKTKYNKFKSTNRGNDNSLSSATIIESGTSGIWATCVRGLEAKATGQLRDVLDEYAAIIYPDVVAAHGDGNNKQEDEKAGEDKNKDDDEDDIEATIKAELDEARDAPKKHIFKTVRIDVACVLYFKVDPPIDPVALVQRICSDAGSGKAVTRTRHINRLTPITSTGKANLEDLQKVAKRVLAPHFHQEGVAGKTFSIRPTIRNNDTLTRQEIIQKIAELVGKQHSVNLSGPDLVILVDIYKNTCGMSVVSGEYEKLKKFNLNELYNSETSTAGGAPEPKSEKQVTDQTVPQDLIPERTEESGGKVEADEEQGKQGEEDS